MPRYQYETSPRKLEPEYVPVRKKNTKAKHKINTKTNSKNKISNPKRKEKSRKKKSCKTNCISISYIWHVTCCKL